MCDANAGVAELVDARDLGSRGESRGGSSPSARTTPTDNGPLKPALLKVAPRLRPDEKVMWIRPCK